MLTSPHAPASSVESSSAHAGGIVLVSVPFGPLMQPSIGLGLLKAALLRRDIASEVLYLTLRFAERIGLALYERITDHTASFDLVGEWVFSKALWDEPPARSSSYVDEVMRRNAAVLRGMRPYPEAFIGDVLGVQALCESFLDEAAREIAARKPRIVGLTSIFQQQIAALALAKRIKRLSPHTCLVMGGANCEGVMGAETARQFPAVDAVVSGEGDLVFVQLVERVLANRAFDDLPGVHTRANTSAAGRRGRSLVQRQERPNHATSVEDMDTLPVPDYTDFFSQLSRAGFEHERQPRLLFETARGCWWGQKNHCTFCGLNGSTMTFRSKSAQRALDELSLLVSRHPGTPVMVVDNILDYRYFDDFLPALAERGLNLQLFYEVKANLRKEQLRLLRAAGVTQLQPGIESLSTDVLRLMRKGVRGIHNIQLLKWCKELGIEAYWNILWGFPGEQPEEYANLVRTARLLTHLAPPQAAATIRLDRFSPNFDEAERRGFDNVAPYPAYHHLYSLAPDAVANLAYFFTFDYREPRDVAEYTRALADEVTAWRSAYESSDLFFVDKDACLLIWDLRPGAAVPLIRLRSLPRALYLACDSARTVDQLERIASEHAGSTVSSAQLNDVLEPLVAAGLMVREDRLYLSLAIPLGDYAPQGAVLNHLREVIETVGQPCGTDVIVPASEHTT